MIVRTGAGTASATLDKLVAGMGDARLTELGARRSEVADGEWVAALERCFAEYGHLNYRTAARTLFLRPYLAHFCPVFSRFFAVFSVLTPGFQKVAPKRPGSGSVTVENGRGKSGRRRPILDG